MQAGRTVLRVQLERLLKIRQGLSELSSVAAYQAAVEKGASLPEALSQMAEAAEKGKESTRDLVAKIGRSARLGERSRGVLDAGATSGALILQTFAKTLSA